MGKVTITDYEKGRIGYEVETEDDEEEHLYVVGLFIGDGDEGVELNATERTTSSSMFYRKF